MLLFVVTFYFRLPVTLGNTSGLNLNSEKCRGGKDYIENNDYRIYPPLPNIPGHNWMTGMTHYKIHVITHQMTHQIMSNIKAGRHCRNIGKNWRLARFASRNDFYLEMWDLLDESCLIGHFYWLDRFEDWSVDPKKYSCPAIGSGRRKGKLFLGGCNQVIPHKGRLFNLKFSF